MRPLLLLLLPFLLTCACAAPSQLHRGALIPPGPVPLVSGCATGLRFEIDNEHNLGPAIDQVHAQVDLETWRLTVHARRVTPAGEIGLAVPFELIWGGVLDPALNRYHALLGLNDLVHVPGDAVSFAQRGEQQVVYQGPAAGVGNPVVWWAARNGGFWVKAQLAAGLGLRAHFVNTGLWRAGAQAGYDSAQWGAEAHLSVPLNPNGSSVSFLGVTPALGASIWRDLGHGLRVTADVQSSPLAQAGRYSSVTAGLNLRYQGFSFEEDLVSPRPDVSLSVDAERPCR